MNLLKAIASPVPTRKHHGDGLHAGDGADQDTVLDGRDEHPSPSTTQGHRARGRSERLIGTTSGADVQIEMPEVSCSSCRAPARIPAQDHVFRCRECGARQVVSATSATIADRPTAEHTDAAGTGDELTLKVESPVASTTVETGGGVHEVSASCPWCGSFVRPAPVCDVCGSPTPGHETLDRRAQVVARPDAASRRVVEVDPTLTGRRRPDS